MKKTIFFILIFFSIFFLFFTNHSEESNYLEIAKSKISQFNPIRKDYVIVIDFRKNLLSERLFVLDMNTKKIIISGKVTHAYNSGLLYATKFSNRPSSEMSSYGTFITKNVKFGKYGYSMVVDGLEKNINDNCKKRAILFHKTSVLWSKGCFATNQKLNQKIIDLTHDGCIVFVIR